MEQHAFDAPVTEPPSGFKARVDSFHPMTVLGIVTSTRSRTAPSGQTLMSITK